MCKVLLIDDIEEQRELFSKILARDNVSITTATASEADALDWRSYDIALVDLMMPKFRGDELVHRQVARYRSYTIPPIVLFSVLNKAELDKIAAQLKRETGLIAIYTITKIAAIGQIMSAVEALIEYVITPTGSTKRRA